jgi:hypothetical protein
VAVVIRFPFQVVYKLNFRHLSPSHRPADKSPGSDACREGRCDSQRQMLMEPMGCVIQEFVSSIAALLDGAPHYSQSIFNRIGDSTSCA